MVSAVRIAIQFVPIDQCSNNYPDRTAWGDGEPNDWQASDNRPGNGPGPSGTQAGGLGEDCVMAFACSNALNRGCNAATEHLYESDDAQSTKDDRDEINDYRRWAITMLAVGSLGCGLAALLACLASVMSGKASATSTADEDQAKANLGSPMRR